MQVSTPSRPPWTVLMNLQQLWSRSVICLTFLLAGFALGPQTSALWAQAGSTTLLTDRGSDPTLESMDDGGFLVVWEGSGEIRAQRTSRAGVPLATDFVVWKHAEYGYGRNPDSARLADGSFVVVWQAVEDGSDYLTSVDILARRLDSAGTPVASEFRVHERSSQSAGFANVEPTSNGGFLVEWMEGGISLYSSSPHVKSVRAFDASGQPLTGDLEVATSTPPSYFSGSRLLKADDGGFLVLWRRSGSADTPLARRLDGAGQPVGGLLSLQGVGPTDTVPALAAFEDGGYRVAWTDPSEGAEAVRFGYLDPDLQSLGSVVVETEIGSPREVEIVVDEQSRPILLWRERRAGSTPEDVAYFRYLNSSDQPTTGVQLVADPAAEAQAAILGLSGDRGLLLWQDRYSSADVYVRSFSVPLLVDGFEGGDLTGWDAHVP